MGLRKPRKKLESENTDLAHKENAATKRQPQITAAERNKANQQKMLEAMQAGERSRVEKIEDAPHEFVEMAIEQIIPNPSNSRTRHIHPKDPLAITLDESHPDYEETLTVIADIKEMADYLKTSPLQTPVSVYRDGTRHYLNEGHVRYFGTLVAYGMDAKIWCKRYFTAPDGISIRRFRENNARHALPIKAKLLDFKSAYEEDIGENVTQEQAANLMGIGRTHFRRMLKAVKTPLIWSAIDNGTIKNLSVIDELQKIGALKDSGKLERALRWMASDSGSDDRLSEWIDDGPTPEKKEAQEETIRAGRRRKRVKIETNDLTIMRRLVRGELWDSFEWTEEDFSSLEAFQNKVDMVFTALKEAEKENKERD